MSKLELTKLPIKNAKINDKQVENIFNMFKLDQTASITAKELNISRQTVNSYYKVIRKSLVSEFDKRNSYKLQKIFYEKTFLVKYLKISGRYLFYIENQNTFLFLDNINISHNLKLFLEEELIKSLINHKKANSAKVIFNPSTNKYTIINFLKLDDKLNLFIHHRLKKFRGINKDNLDTHIKESIFRFNYNHTSILKQAPFS
jgi:transposase